MFKTTKSRIIALALVGVLVLAGGIYAAASLITGTASAQTTVAVTPGTASTATGQTVAAQAPSPADEAKLKAAILEMLKDRMGLTGPNAEAFADQMIQRMQNVNPNFDFQSMLDWCNRYFDENAGGSGSTAPGTTRGYGNMPCWGGNAGGGPGGGAANGVRGGMMGGWDIN